MGGAEAFANDGSFMASFLAQQKQKAAGESAATPTKLVKVLPSNVSWA